MKITTAREQLEMLSPWRQAAQEPSPFPWTKDDREWAYGPGTEAYHAPLENGHRLRVWDDTITEPRWAPGGDIPPEPAGSHWKGGFDHGVDFPSDPDAGPPYPEHPAWTAVYEEDSPLRAKAYPTREQAMRAVEKKYREMFPLGTDTGPHDSGIDYSDLNKFKDYL